MIQFNLLPNVKANYIKAKRTKRNVVLAAIGAIALSMTALLALFLIVFVVQSLRLKNLDKSIKSLSSTIKNQTDINKILTIQNQLTSIDSLHNEKPEVGRLFTYIAQVVPSKITVESYSLNFDKATPTMSFSGQAPSLEEVNKFVDTLKFTTIAKTENDKDATKAFSQVVLESFGVDTKGAGYTISLNYDPSIFASDEASLKLSVPQITSTRSTTERPEALFKENQTPVEGNKP